MSHTYTAIVLENTGLNSVNIPISKSVARACATNEHICTGLTLTQQKWLSNIRVPLNWADVNEADYVLIYAETTGTTVADAFCYFVTGVTMQAEDVAELAVIPDFLTSVGVANLTLIDGLTIRSTYALENIAPQNLSCGDPYLAPSEPMTLLTEWIGEGDEYRDYIDSTINIIVTGQIDVARTATDSVTGDGVTYPIPEYAENGRFATYQLFENGVADNTARVFKSPGAMLFVYSDTNTSVNQMLQKGLSKIRGMGLESAILHCVRIPTKYADVETSYDVNNSTASTGETVEQHYVLLMAGKWNTDTTSIDLIQDSDGSREAGVCNFSEFAKYGIMSASGESMECDPKDLKTTTNPKIVSIGDPRPEGRPYFRFEKVNNDKISHIEFFRNSISGLKWKETALVFTEQSGNALNTAQYQANRNIANVGMSNAFKSGVLNYSQLLEMQQLENTQAKHRMELNTAINAMGVIGSMAEVGIDVGLSTGVQMGDLSESVRFLQQGANDILNYAQMGNMQNLVASQTEATTKQNYANLEATYSAQKLADELSYGIQQNIVVPTIMFPYNTETLRDFYGNGVLVYRFWYTTHDASRIKKILRAYGAKYSMRTASAHLQIPTGKDFIYIETQGVTIGDLPKWQADGVSLQLNNGVRIWNTRPHHIA